MATDLVALAEQIQKYWSPIYVKQLREKLLLGGLVNKDYQGSIKQGGDEVTVTQVVAATGANKTVGVDADTFDTEDLQVLDVKIKANKRAVAAFEFKDIVHIQTQLDKQDPEIMDALNFAIEKQINDYLYSLVAPSDSSPDHTRTSVSDYSLSEHQTTRVQAGEAKWLKNKPWYALLSPAYYMDLMSDTYSADNTNDKPLVGGEMLERRLGFWCAEDDSRTGDYGLFFHPDFMHLVMQTALQVKISDMHVLGKFGYKMSVDIIYGAKLGIEGAKKHITVTS